MCGMLVSVHGLKNEVYSCVARRLRDCGTAGLRDCRSSFSSKIFGGPGILQSSQIIVLLKTIKKYC